MVCSFSADRAPLPNLLGRAAANQQKNRWSQKKWLNLRWIQPIWAVFGGRFEFSHCGSTQSFKKPLKLAGFMVKLAEFMGFLIRFLASPFGADGTTSYSYWVTLVPLALLHSGRVRPSSSFIVPDPDWLRSWTWSPLLRKPIFIDRFTMTQWNKMICCWH